MLHKEDEMTPSERMSALNKGEEVDRMPIALILAANMGCTLGMTYRQAFESAENRALCQLKAYELFGYDGLGVTYSLHGLGIALGAEIKEPEDAPPSVEIPPIKDIRDLSVLDMEKITLKHDKLARLAYDSGRIILDKAGNEIGVGGALPGPFTSASSLLGTEQLLKSTKRYPEELHKVLQFCTDAVIELGKEFLKEDIMVGLMDPVASGTLIRRDKYNEFVFPYTKKIVEEWKKFKPDLKIDCHVCGDTTDILENMADTGIDSISLDNIVDLVTAKEKIGNKISVSGNVHPVDVMYQGTKKDVEDAVKSCYRKAWDFPKGFTINTGCDLPMHTPIENIYTYMKTARLCASFQASMNRHPNEIPPWEL